MTGPGGHHDNDPGDWHGEEPDWLAAERSDAARHGALEDDPQWEIDASLPPAHTYTPAAPVHHDPGDGLEHTSWWPVDLANLFDGTHTPLRPTICERDDAQALLYPGKCHAFNGESESGKTWFALIACVQVVNNGGHVLYIDFEDTADTVVARLLALGAKPDSVIARFHYLQPSEPIFTGKTMKYTPASDDLASIVETWPLTLAVIDGVTEAMTMHGLELNDNADYARFHGQLPRRLALTGAAVAQIDHVTKSSEHRGRYALGAQHKLAAMDGAVFGFNRRRPFGLGRHGMSEVTIEKDRVGQLRQHARGKRIVELHLESDRETHALAWRLAVPEADDRVDDDRADPVTDIMERISRHLEQNPQGVTKRALREIIPGGHHQIDQAIDLLRIAWIRVDKEGRGHLHVSTRPYRAGDETPTGGADTAA